MSYFKLLLVVGWAFFFCYPASISAQEKEGKKSKKDEARSGGFGYFAFSGQQISIGALNSQLNANGYPTLNDQSISFGGGGMAVLSNFMLGGEGHSLRTDTRANEEYSIDFSTGYGTFNVGYLTWHTPDFMFYPYIGIGGGTVEMTITDKDFSKTFDDIIQSPKHSVELTKRNLLVTPALAFMYRITPGLMLGAQLGYVYVYKQDPWKLSDVPLDKGPPTSMQGPFLRLTVGGGGL